MQETLKHRKAFELYYAMGGDRTVIGLAKKLGVCKSTVGLWSKGLDWQAQIAKRDKKNGAAISKAVDKAIVNEATNHRKTIKESLTIIRGAISTAVKNIKNGTLQVTKAQDLASLTTAQKELVRLDLLLAGEADSRKEHILKFMAVYPEGYTGPRMPVESKVIDNANGT